MIHVAKNIQFWGLDKLVPYEKNSRTHSDEQVDQIAASIKEFGFTNPILVDSKDGIIAGHGRLMAARSIGMKEVPVIILDHLTDAQKRAYVIADNKLALNAGWDLETLAAEIKDLRDEEYDISVMGFSEDELGQLLLEIEELDPQSEEDEVPEAPITPITKRGDVWLLGRHRLRCGDSTMIDEVDALTDGKKIDMVFTDPPYNIGYQDMAGDFTKIKNDKMDDGKFVQFLKDCLQVDTDTFYVCCSWQYVHLFRQAMDSTGKPVKAWIVWNKVNPAQNLDKYFKAHEFILYHGKFGGEKTLRGDVWECKRQRNTVHPTMKPVELIELALEDNPGKKTVYDAFGGSGSTLIACEKTGKTCFTMELEEKYCDVIVKRWQEFTGKKAKHEDGRLFDDLKVD